MNHRAQTSSEYLHMTWSFYAKIAIFVWVRMRTCVYVHVRVRRRARGHRLPSAGHSS